MNTALRVPNGLTGLGNDRGMTLTILGCGTLGIAILSGILSSLTEASTAPSPAYPDSGTATPTTEGPPQRTPTNFIACVRRPESAKRIKLAVQEYRPGVMVLQNENVRGVEAADVVILGCKPYMVADILLQEGMKEALAGKLLISICAGVPVEQMSRVLYGQNYPADNPQDACTLVRVMPNTAALVRESMTVIATNTPPLPSELSTLVDWIFTRIGRVVHLPPAMMDVSTALCGSGPAFLALMLESLADGAVAMGLPRAEAQLMAAQTMRGTAGLVQHGEHPALVREKVSTPGGCTIGGLLVLEEGRVRGTVARSVREATVVAAQLGKGISGVNGTRFERQ
ncbi:pyrroline-5-carboxylate reductase [Exophiala aquamarina CBS 119918]|uniref:Pyrroline-5-carboxylate reductase n=1 Tax=Exophiala aquamarina CBS 119918 TaxID=1182545 RepID=A0A072PJC0_9EURO|nr:pyrroline-5-carboxylate reductase [Exophiala aquamarina CBS 119918]KEF59986.1 pyrroline-5-carboxylate reductase [Exophiala aquamarina CBS 119918]